MTAPPPPTRYEDAERMPGDIWCLTVHGEEKKTVYAGGAEGKICRWDGDTFASYPTVYEGHTAAVTGIAVIEGADPPAFFSISTDQTIRRWETATGNSKVFDTCRDWARCMVMQGDALFVGGNDHDITWYPSVGGETPTEKTLWPGHSDWVSCLLPSEGSLFSGSYDNSIRQWDVGSAAPGTPAKTTAVFRGHSGHVKSVVVTAQGQLLSASRDGTLRLWQLDGGDGGEEGEAKSVRSGACLAILQCCEMQNCLARVPEGTNANLAYVGGSDGVLRCINTRMLKEAQENFAAVNRKALADSRSEEEKRVREKVQKLERRMKKQLKEMEGKLREEATAEAKAAKAAAAAEAAATAAADGAEAGDGEAEAEAEPAAEEEGQEEERVKLTGTLPEDHPKFQDLEKERARLQGNLDADRKEIEAKLADRIRVLESFYIGERTYEKEGEALLSQYFYTELPPPAGPPPGAVLCLSVRDEPVPGQEGVTVPALFRVDGRSIARQSGKVTSRTI